MVRGRRNPLYVGLPVRLKRARGNLSFQSIADAAEIPDGQVVFRLERRTGHVPRCDTVEKIAYALDLSPALLAYGIEGTDSQPSRDFRCAGIANRLRDTRIIRGLSVLAVARAAGVSHTAVGNIERGTMPGIDTAELLANALGVSPGWLAYGLGPVELQNRRAIRSKPTQAEPSESNTSTEPAS